MNYTYQKKRNDPSRFTKTIKILDWKITVQKERVCLSPHCRSGCNFKFIKTYEKRIDNNWKFIRGVNIEVN